VGESIPVIPAQHGTEKHGQSAWLLKVSYPITALCSSIESLLLVFCPQLHGCVTRPKEIVLSRDHYMEYDSNHSALAGIVQSKLLTKHMCFFGFSLTDDNFFKIMSHVRSATLQRKQQLGTCVMLFTSGVHLLYSRRAAGRNLTPVFSDVNQKCLKNSGRSDSLQWFLSLEPTPCCCRLISPE
jgi:hypothetical protein